MLEVLRYTAWGVVMVFAAIGETKIAVALVVGMAIGAVWGGGTVLEEIRKTGKANLREILIYGRCKDE